MDNTIEQSSTQNISALSRRLIKKELIDGTQALQAEQSAQKAKVPLIRYLLNQNIIATNPLLQSAAEEFAVPYLDLTAFEIDRNTVNLVSDKLIRGRHVLPLSKRGNRLYLATSDPSDLQTLNDIRFQTRLTIEVVLVEHQQLMEAIDQALESPETALNDLTDSELDDLELIQDKQEEAPLPTDADVNDAPVVRFINKILLDAIKRGASDIHIETYEKRCRIRLRLDGVLQEVSAPPVNLAARLISRIKVMAELDISERRKPQDGRIKLNLSKNRAVDFRVSTCPTLFGEKVVLRILDSMNVQLDANQLGFTDEQKAIYDEYIHKPYGMILVTGPTGSGKTVTLYTAIQELNTVGNNISTAEDPAEIYMQGVNQVNINPKAGLTFANALRAFLRQDPDIIMVGEIRDLETAEIAIKSAQTGHMVLSTLHTNDAPQSLTRLVNMGVAPYNIASTISLIIAQRLVRKLCPHCKQEEKLPRDVLLDSGFHEDEIASLKTYAPKGCDKCNDGYRGRIGIFQVMPITEAIERIILEGGNALQIEKQAEEEGVIDLRRAGLLKVKEGITSLEEIHRVTRD